METEQNLLHWHRQEILKVGIRSKLGIGEEDLRLKKNTPKVTLAKGKKWHCFNLRVG